MQILICYFFLPKDICNFLDCRINWAGFTVNSMLPLKMLLKPFLSKKRGTTLGAKML